MVDISSASASAALRHRSVVVIGATVVVKPLARGVNRFAALFVSRTSNALSASSSSTAVAKLDRVGEELHDEGDGGVETAVRDANEDVAGLEAGRRDCGEGQGFEEGAAAG